MTVTDVRRFAYRQGPGKGLFGGAIEIDDSAPTTAALPPTAARGSTGHPLPHGTVDLLAAAPYPHGRTGAAAGDRAGHLLLTAFGLQRREPSNRFNDHRVVASVRSKFPVHVLTVSDGGAAYLDLYRHALVDLDLPDSEVPAPLGDLDVLLAARYTDLPTPYGRLRCALGDLETGINLRSLLVAAQLAGVPARLSLDGEDSATAARLIGAADPGRWSAPVRVALSGLTAPAGGQPLPGAPSDPAVFAAADRLLAAESGHPSLTEAEQVNGHRFAARYPLAAPALGIPAATADSAPPGTGWDGVFWNRSAGRVPDRLSGFSGRPVRLPESAVQEFLAWAAVPAPSPELAEIGRRVRLLVALQNVGDRPTGYYEASPDGLRPVRENPTVMTSLQAAFGYPVSPGTDCGLRHASMVWTYVVDVPELLADLGPAAWSLLQLWCGWTAHGLELAAAALGLYARPARSYDEFRVQRLAGLSRRTVPVFMTVCGRSRFAEPMLDLRT
ncbi:hypothetical protein ACIRPK_32015 [Kitasatospora sp. NPDC101801]|uniref:hypothetical protein n=1 Tax=Kitasatospora sp. NPDC101801 TaxID=3364103 RepID=UPI00380AF80C